MTHQQVIELGTQLLEQHGLLAKGWKFVIDTGPKSRRLGQCRYGPKEIGITSWYAEHNTDETVIDTIRHEVAHACAGEYDQERGHGHAWKRWCAILGCAARSFKTQIEGLPRRFRAVCTLCGKSYGKDIRPKQGHMCTCQRHLRGHIATADQIVALKWEVNPSFTGAIASHSRMDDNVKSLLNDLANATDSAGKKRIRAKLRKLGHRGGLNA